jgi:hypothetical protein
MSLLLLFGGAATQPAPVRVNRNTHLEHTETCRSKARAAGAFLVLTLAAPNWGSLTGTLDGVTLSSGASAPISATLTATLADATLSSGAQVDAASAIGSLTATLDPATLSAGASAPIASSLAATLSTVTLSSAASAPVTATSATTLDTATLSSGASIAEASPPIFLRIRRPVVLEEGIEVGRRYHAIQGDHVTAPALLGAFNQTLDGVTLSAGASSVDASVDIYLGSETRREAYPEAAFQWHRVKYPSLLTVLFQYTAQLALDTTFDSLTLSSKAYGPALGDLTATLGDLTFSSTGAVADSPTGDLSVTLDTVTLASKVGVDAAFSTTLDGLALASLASQITMGTGEFGTIALDGVTGSGRATTTSEAQLVVALDGVTLAAQQQPVYGTAQFAATLGGITLSSVAQTQDVLGANADLDLEGVTLAAEGAGSDRRVKYLHVTGRHLGWFKVDSRAKRMTVGSPRDRIT